ncbi:hypothetical protein I317_02848 [Kwoniella heveanensis CBS 569]|uniref:Condensation domain-containing protein n=1 Tax=Kwoniella heveanensis BCC8398 TaxID=1296120 RepID=A0A1B9GS20_9TREE|nr:hypothetical protein I316_04719 [Kwoniella heveanensis BCC8398]OCF43280.1 hypothetical protein I317_02848 [Kwoniella heveanensis CBS 569]
MAALPLTPPYTPLTSSFSSEAASFSVQKDAYPVQGIAQQNVVAPLTPPDSPDGGWKASLSSEGRVRRTLSFGEEAEVDQPEGSKRKLSDNELSYYLPSRADGVNDMYLHHSLAAPQNKMTPTRMLYLWAYQLLRHPLLASKIDFRGYEDISFVAPRPASVVQALALAADRFAYLTDERDIIDSYLNGPRTLSNERLGYLVIKAGSASASALPDAKADYEVMLCATHYLGDGMALHTFMNEFYTLLGSDKTVNDISQLISSAIDGGSTSIPNSLEDRLPLVGDGGKFAQAVGAEEYKRSEARLIGGQSFASNKIKMDRQTVVPTISFDAAKTKAILGECKTNGVTIAHAVFALCNLAWAKRTKDREAPCLIYSALNLRPNMLPSPTASTDSFFHLAVGYFNIVLPTLLPSIPISDLFWHRARMTKSQTIKAVKSPFVVARSRETSVVRKQRAVKWAKIDDEEEERARQRTTPTISPSQNEKKPAISQKALMGLSMLGNLDGMYKHAAFPELELKSLTTGSRQRAGGLLLFAYTFAGKLWFSLGYDKNGFAPGEIEGFWAEVQALVEEVLI